MNQNDCERIEVKLDSIDKRLDKIDVHLAIYNEQLKEHIRRTNLLEQEMKPVQEHVIAIKGIGKGIAMLATSLGIILSILKLTGKI